MKQELIDYLNKCREDDLKNRGNILIKDYYGRVYYLKDGPIFFNSKNKYIVFKEFKIVEKPIVKKKKFLFF